MQYNKRTNIDIKENFLQNLLIDRGVFPTNQEDVEKFLYPTIKNEHSPVLLDHMEQGFWLLIKHITSGSKLLLVVDPDCDGFTSSALFYNYLVNHLLGYKNFNFTIDYHIPEGKEHGLDTMMKDLYPIRKYDLIILPDSSSNDYDYHKQLSEIGYDLLVLDHHEAERYSEHAVVINNQLSQNYPNKALSGVGVVYKFFEYLEGKFNAAAQEEEEFFESYSTDYLDLVALGQISDVMTMTTLENRWICDYGLSHINSKFFKELIEKQEYSLKTNEQPLNQIGIAFYITPLINALIRVGSIQEKTRLFEAFITPDIEIDSTKRGEKGLKEKVSTQAVRNCVNAKARQTRERDKAAELLDIQIIENCLDENKILILNADELNVSNTLTGLCAMGIATKYKKPVMLGRTTPDGKYMKGSIRNRDGSPLRDFKKFLNDSGYMEYVEGHASAAGWGCSVANLDKLMEYANRELKDVDFNEGCYDVDFVIKNNKINLSNLIFELSHGAKLWGQGCPEPVIAIEGIRLPIEHIQVIGTNNDTIRFSYAGVTFVKFKALNYIEKIKEMNGEVLITVVGRGNINRWGGRETPQILCDDIEIKELVGF